MKYTLFQDFARKMPGPAPPTVRPGPAQSGRTPEFGYGHLVKMKCNDGLGSILFGVTTPTLGFLYVRRSIQKAWTERQQNTRF